MPTPIEALKWLDNVNSASIILLFSVSWSSFGAFISVGRTYSLLEVKRFHARLTGESKH